MSTLLKELPTETTVALPGRDTPRETLQHTTDPQSVPSYLPPKAPEYIPQPQPTQPTFDYTFLMAELRLPVLLAALYYLFNMNFVQAFIERVAPSLKESSRSDMVKSALFGVFYYAFNYLLEHFQKK